MSFSPANRDDLCCRECWTPIGLDEYRRWGLCEDCEREREVERFAEALPDAPPEWWSEGAA